MAALAARPSASALRPVITAAAPGVVVAVVAAAVVPPVGIAAVAVATRRTLVGSRIVSRIGSRIGSRVIVLIRPRLVPPLLRHISYILTTARSRTAIYCNSLSHS